MSKPLFQFGLADGAVKSTGLDGVLATQALNDSAVAVKFESHTESAENLMTGRPIRGRSRAVKISDLRPWA